ncbi:MAG: hypothetical protein IJW03_02685 [Clostridia bacterium]|nr:hypothetical protein [Clostridia bacterium]
MKKTLLFLFTLIFTLSLVSCSEERSADELMSEFLESYGAEGIVYSPRRAEGEDGYIDSALFHKIYVLETTLPRDFAIFLNSHTSSDSECGVFICDSTAQRIEIEEMCLERMTLLSSEYSFISRSGNVVFYSTMTDKTRTERIWHSVISR